MVKYEVIGHIRFQGADGKQVDAPCGTIISFEEGDQVDVPSLLTIGAIVACEEKGNDGG